MRTINLGILDHFRPTVNFISHTNAPPGTQWGPRIIPDCQLFYVISGEAELHLGPQTFRIQSGQCAFFGMDSPHNLLTRGEVTYFSLHFHWEHDSPQPVHPAYQIQACTENDLLRHPITYVIEVPEFGSFEFPHCFSIQGIEPIFMHMVNEYRNERPASAWVLRGLMIELLSAMIRHLLHSKPPSPTKKKIEPALLAIAQHPETNWTIPELAGLCGYHSIYFSFLFKEITGVSPKQYLISERIRKAKYYLLSGEKMEVIAEKLGYTSIHYFSRNFKEETGLTPTEFKQQEH